MVVDYKKIKQNQPNKSGKKLEQKCKSLLEKYNIPYKHNNHKGIDFIIWPDNPNETIYLDCKSINGSGTAIERTPHTVYKYHKLYQANKIYILEGKVNNPNDIRDHCNSICRTKFIKLKDLEIIVTKKQVINPRERFWK